MNARRFSPGSVIAVVALVFALAGSAVALPGKGTVDSNDLKRGAVKSKAIKAAAVSAKKIKNGAVGADKLADGSVGTAKIADGSVGADKLADGSVRTDKLAADSVGTAKIADNAVTDAKVANANFQPLPLNNGYEPVANLAAPSYAVDNQGIVHLHGVATQPSSAGGTLGTLPAEARPSSTVFAGAICATLGASEAALVTISTDGGIGVTAHSGGNPDRCQNQGFASLDGVSFPAG